MKTVMTAVKLKRAKNAASAALALVMHVAVAS